MKLDLLLVYLLVVNVVTLVLGLVGAGPLALEAFALMGGGPAALVASFARDRHTRKDNVSPRFVAVWASGLWALILANVYDWHRFSPVRLAENLSCDHTPLLVFLAAINLLTFVLFCVDKHRAKTGDWRIPEGVLLGLSLAGGSVGGLLGMLVAHHKVRKARFMVGLPLTIMLQAAILVHLIQAGVV